MIVSFEREPFGWVHPMYRQRHHHQPHHRPRNCYSDWDDFFRPALGTMSTLGHLLQMAEPLMAQSMTQSMSPQREEPKNDKFEVKLNVQQFTPEELDVKMIGNSVVVEGKHEEKQDEQGYISRHFVRRYQLPEDVNPETVTCNLGSDGILLVSAPRMLEKKPETPKSIPINVTSQPAVTQQEEKKEETKKEDKPE